MYTKSLTTIAAILDAAEERFVADSYDDITLASVAARAGVTKGAIYHHFRNKDHLFLSMMDRYLDSLHDALHEAARSACSPAGPANPDSPGGARGDTDGSARDCITQLTKAFLRLPISKQRVVQLVRRDAHRFRSADRKRLVAAYQRALPEQIEGILEAGIHSGELVRGDSRLMSWQYVAIVEVGLSDYARRSFKNTDNMVRQFVSIFFDGANPVTRRCHPGDKG